MKKIGILIVAFVMLFACTACTFLGSDYRPVMTNGVEAVGTMPELFEKKIAEDGGLGTGTTIGNVLVAYNWYSGDTIAVNVYDLSANKKKTLEYSYDDFMYYYDKIYPAKDECFFMTLQCFEEDADEVPTLIVKSDLKGKVLWEASFSTGTSILDLTEAENGMIYVLGMENETSFIAKLDSNGKILSNTNVKDGLENATFYELEGLSDHEIVGLYGNGEQDLNIALLNANGNVLWNTNVFDDVYEYFYLTVMNQQIYCCVEQGTKCFVYALDLQGTLLWSQEFTDEEDVFLLTGTKETQPVMTSSKGCFLLNPKDGSVERYLFQEEIGVTSKICYFNDYYVALSSHKCGGIYYNFSRVSDLYEDVYSAYDYDGKLLWRKGFTYE